MRIVILLVPLLAACGGASSSSTASQTEPTSGDESTPGSTSDEGLECSGPYQRGSSGVVACPNRDGGWSVLACSGCETHDGACAHPAYEADEHVSGCDPEGSGDCPSPRRVEAGTCHAACCDSTLSALPPEVEETLPTQMPGL